MGDEPVITVFEHEAILAHIRAHWQAERDDMARLLEALIVRLRSPAREAERSRQAAQEQGA